MTRYSKTIYIECEAGDEIDAANAIYAALRDATEDPVIIHVDYDGPLEPLDDDLANELADEAADRIVRAARARANLAGR